MRLVTKDLKCLGCGSEKSDDLRHLLSEGKGSFFSPKGNIVRRFYYFAPCNLVSFPVTFSASHSTAARRDTLPREDHTAEDRKNEPRHATEVRYGSR